MAARFVLVAHLRDRLAAAAEIETLPDHLRSQLQAVLAQSDRVEPVAAIAPLAPDGADAPAPPEVVPPTVDEELIDGLSRWAASDAGRSALASAHLDYHDYSLIALLSGTTVHLPARQAEIYKQVDGTRYLPTYLLPHAPLLSPLRTLTQQTSTALNVLFSILGSGFAVFYAARAVSYRLETAVLLGVAAAVVVGVADAVGVWIYVDRLGRERAAARDRARQMAQGSGAATDEGDDATDAAAGAAAAAQAGEVPGTTTTALPRREVRLRRRGLGEAGP